MNRIALTHRGERICSESGTYSTTLLPIVIKVWNAVGGIGFATIKSHYLNAQMGQRIFVIEDDDTVRDTIDLLLSDKGYQVTTSANGANVLPHINKHQPDLVITDIFLGDADGREICQNLKNNPETRHIPVIIMSGASGEIYNTISDVGANDIVLKPFDEHTLLSRVCRQLSA